MYRAFIADYAAGRPVCAYLSEDARAIELGQIVDSALELFETSAPPLLEGADAACESIRTDQRPTVLRMGELSTGHDHRTQPKPDPVRPDGR